MDYKKNYIDHSFRKKSSNISKTSRVIKKWDAIFRKIEVKLLLP